MLQLLVSPNAVTLKLSHCAFDRDTQNPIAIENPQRWLLSKSVHAMCLQALRKCMRVQAAFVRVHQDFTANVLRGGKPQIVKNVREELERDLPLEEFKHWTALVRLAVVLHVILLSLQLLHDVHRGGKPQNAKNVREEFKQWTALVDSLASPRGTASWHCSMRVTFHLQK